MLKRKMLYLLGGVGAGGGAREGSRERLVTGVAGLPLLGYADGLRKKMDSLLLLESDVAEIIKRAESGENGECRLFDPVAGNYTAHGRVGEITCWVVYRPDGAGCFVENVYCHRMRLAGE
jgi:hypothetical protein